MADNEFLAALERAGMSKRKLAKDLGVAYTSVIRWKAEARPYAMAYLRVVAERNDLRAKWEARHRGVLPEPRTVVGSDHAVSYGPRAGVAVPKAGVSRRVPPKGLTGSK